MIANQTRPEVSKLTLEKRRHSKKQHTLSSLFKVIKILDTFLRFLYTGLKLLQSSWRCVSLFVASLDSARISLVTYDFLLFSEVNFETSGLDVLSPDEGPDGAILHAICFVYLLHEWLFIASVH